MPRLKLLYKLKNTEVEVVPTLSIQQLKEQAAEWSEVPMDLLKLLFRGRTVDESSTVEETGMRDGSKVHVIRSIVPSNRDVTDVTSQEMTKTGGVLTKVEKEVDEIEVQMKNLHKDPSESSQKPKPLVLNELLTQKLLLLDGLDVEGDERLRRRSLIGRINDLCSRLDDVKED